MKAFVTKFGSIIVAVLVGLTGLGFASGAVAGTTYDVSKLVGDVYQGINNTLVFHNGSYVGPQTGGNGVKLATPPSTGSCTIWAPATTIAASTTQAVECQAAINGGITRIAGITADSVCTVIEASSTNAVVNGIAVVGSSASSTVTSGAGSIVLRLSNLTGASFPWTSTASSSSKWKYVCFDPA